MWEDISLAPEMRCYIHDLKFRSQQLLAKTCVQIIFQFYDCSLLKYLMILFYAKCLVNKSVIFKTDL